MKLHGWLKIYSKYSKSLVSIMWPSVYSWLDIVHQLATSDCAKPCCQLRDLTASILTKICPVQKCTIFHCVFSSFHSHTNTLQLWFYLFLHPSKIMSFKNVECSYFPLSPGLSAYLIVLPNGQLFLICSWSRK